MKKIRVPNAWENGTKLITKDEFIKIWKEHAFALYRLTGYDLDVHNEIKDMVSRIIELAGRRADELLESEGEYHQHEV